MSDRYNIKEGMEDAWGGGGTQVRLKIQNDQDQATWKNRVYKLWYKWDINMAVPWWKTKSNCFDDDTTDGDNNNDRNHNALMIMVIFKQTSIYRAVKWCTHTNSYENNVASGIASGGWGVNP